MPMNNRDRINNMSQAELIELVNSQRTYICKQDKALTKQRELTEYQFNRAESNAMEHSHTLMKYTSLKRKHKKLKRTYNNLVSAYMDKLETIAEMYSK